METTIHVHTGGACHGDPGPGGFAAVIDLGDSLTTISGNDPRTASGRMDLMAAPRGLEAVELLTGTDDRRKRINLYTRSESLLHFFNQGRAGLPESHGLPVRAEDPDLRRDLDQAVEGRDVTCIRVRDTAGHPMSERRLRLAREQAEKARNGEASITATTSEGSDSGLAADTAAESDRIRRALEETLPRLFRSRRDRGGCGSRSRCCALTGVPSRCWSLVREESYVVTDSGDALETPEGRPTGGWSRGACEMLVDGVCRSLGVEIRCGRVTAMAGNRTGLGEAVMRTAQAILRIAAATQQDTRSRSNRP